MNAPQSSSLKLAVLISGSGRTLNNLIDLAAEGHLPIDIRLVISSSPTAGGLKFAEAAAVQTQIISRSDFAHGGAGSEAFGDKVFSACRDAGVDYVAMAGFMNLAPLPDDFAGRVVNIHPS